MSPNAESLRESLAHCRCNNLHNHWIHGSKQKPAHRARLTAYVRVDGYRPSSEQQIQLIKTFCDQHQYELVNIFQERGREPGRALNEALNSLESADGIVAVDLERFVHNHKDRLRDLKPFIHNFFCHTERYLLTVSEGIDTSTAAGQTSAVEFFSAVKDFQ